MPSTLVTGANGHVGANLVRALLERGETVRALILPGTSLEPLAGLDLERVEGDVRDPASLDRAMRGIERAYHLAAFVSLRAGDRRVIYETNVLGTRHVLEAAERAGVKRLVYCSSFGAVGQNPNGASDESWTVNPWDTHLDYELSKAMAELDVHRAANRGLDVVTVNPCGIVGPHDYGPSSVGKTILDFAHRRMRAYVAGAFDFVSVRDVVAGHLLAMERGKRGERYILAGGYHSLDEILDHLQAVTGVPKPRLKLPVQAMLPLATVSSLVMRAFFPQVPPRFTPGTVRLLNCGKRADAGKAQRELGLEPTSVLEAFTESVEWFRRVGKIPRA